MSTKPTGSVTFLFTDIEAWAEGLAMGMDRAVALALEGADG
jgi:hypothetical protein